MAEKDIRKMSRQELLELLIERSRENDELRIQLGEANLKIEELNARSVETEPVVASAYKPHQAGSLSEEAFRVGGILEAAQKSADFYLNSIERMHRECAAVCEKAETETHEKCAKLLQETEAKCRNMREETQAHTYQLLEESRKKSEETQTTARENAESIIAAAQKEADEMLAQARSEGSSMEEVLKKRYDEACETARVDANRNWEEIKERLDSICAEHAQLREQIVASGEKKRKW